MKLIPVILFCQLLSLLFDILFAIQFYGSY
jgi:hypothetical protein